MVAEFEARVLLLAADVFWLVMDAAGELAGTDGAALAVNKLAHDGVEGAAWAAAEAGGAKFIEGVLVSFAGPEEFVEAVVLGLATPCCC